MKKLIVVLFLVLVSVQFTACGILQPVGTDPIQTVDQMIAAGEYDAAESLILRIQPSHPQYGQAASRLRTVRKLIMDYESKTRREATALEAQQNWSAVFALYKKATQKLPNSMVLLRASDAALSRYNTMIDKAKGIALLNKAKLIINDHVTYIKLLATNPSDRALQLNVQRNQQDADIVARDLVLLGDRALVRQQTDDSRDYWDVAYQLSSSEVIKSRLDSLPPKKPMPKKPLSNNTKPTDTTIKLDNYKQALEEGDLLTAQKMMEELWLHESANEEVQILQAQLQRNVELHVREQSQLAEQLYSQGEYEQARLTWLAVLPLDPENLRIKADITRAERVIANIDELRKRQ